MTFRDRAQGGEQLALRLERYRAARPIVLALAGGGVRVAVEVARRLGTGLEVIVVRKIRAPSERERVIGAVAEGGAVYVDLNAARELGLRDADVATLAGPVREEVERRVALYRGGRVLPDLVGRTVLLVDDGVGTGATARAAYCALRARGAARVILAAPVVAALSEPRLRATFDDVVAVERPLDFVAVGASYRDFPRLSDEDVCACLRLARGVEEYEARAT